MKALLIILIRTIRSSLTHKDASPSQRTTNFPKNDSSHAPEQPPQLPDNPPLTFVNALLSDPEGWARSSSVRPAQKSWSIRPRSASGSPSRVEASSWNGAGSRSEDPGRRPDRGGDRSRVTGARAPFLTVKVPDGGNGADLVEEGGPEGHPGRDRSHGGPRRRRAPLSWASSRQSARVQRGNPPQIDPGRTSRPKTRPGVGGFGIWREIVGEGLGGVRHSLPQTVIGS